MVSPAGAPSVPAEPAVSVGPVRPEDFPAIAELTVRVYVDGGLTARGSRPSWPTSRA